MSEIRIHRRQVLIIVLFIVVILIIVHKHSQQFCIEHKDLNTLYTQKENSKLFKIYAITPTYMRPAQKAELTRLSHIFMLLPNLHWIIIEDHNTTTQLVSNLIKNAGLSKRSTHLYIKTPTEYKLQNKDPNWIKPRGVEQRNAALSWIRSNVDPANRSIVFFMDDDNAYSIELFAEMIKIEKGRVGVWPVGLVGGLKVEKPILNDDNTKVIGFNAVWRPERPFPMDMASFATSTDLFFKNPKAQFSYEVLRGYQESQILQYLTTVDKLQPLANNCQSIMVWHTRTEKTKLTAENVLNMKGIYSDAGMEV